MQLTDENKNRLQKIKDGSRQLAETSEGTTRKPFRLDGYVNMLNKYGTAQDNSTAYSYVAETLIPDETLTTQYESNGLFAKIIDIPAQEAVKKGFKLNIADEQVEEYVQKRIKDLAWSATAELGLKWSRLYGGAIGVMILNDGSNDLSQPVNWKKVKGIEEIVIYDRSCVTPDYHSLYNNYGVNYEDNRRRSKFRQPQFYNVFSIYGNFRVHESRCLVFRNGIMPEKASSMEYRFWGAPEYARIKRALREAITAHGYSVRLLERCVQAVYKMKDLSQLLATDEGEDQVIRRLQTIDMARGILNSITIDTDGEDYDFRSVSLTGVKEVIESACNMLSAITEIPQTKLFGRSPAGMNSTGESDLENYYNFIDKIRETQLSSNLCTLVDVIIQIGVNRGELTAKPEYDLEFESLWNESETERATIDQTNAQTKQVKAQTAQLYVDMGVLDPAEVRKQLKADGEYGIEDETLPEQDNPLAELIAQQSKQPMPLQNDSRMDEDDIYGGANSVGVLVFNGGKILVGERSDTGEICGSGGHIENWEDALGAAQRETEEEFGIIVTDLIPLGVIDGLDEQYGKPFIFLANGYSGAPLADTQEMRNNRFVRLQELVNSNLFEPFKQSISLLFSQLDLNGADSEFFKNFGKIHEKGFTSVGNNAIMNSEEIETDGAPKGNQNAAGPHKRTHLSAADKKSYEKRIVGQKTSDGVTITKFWSHAFDRIAERNISKGQIEKMLQSDRVSPDKTHPERNCYDIKGKRLVVDTKTGEIITVEWRKQNQ